MVASQSLIWGTFRALGFGVSSNAVSSSLVSEVRAGLTVMARQDPEDRARREAEIAERRRQDAERHRRAAAMRQTIETFRTR
ncbi:hypothetical protein [Methylobacterium sp. J-067]|jgi:hypothetical protein|uniref:hypothetical protein n=1 Tax=Methylobacterium sp. J-067 TaxID=2836648 RepID=UPI001FB9F13A|nr:hypothetical protein [Methylobacterium sp. J-067]MCJ2023014.1 hypothetical protein [Methylobacterium sp. J-067]